MNQKQTTLFVGLKDYARYWLLKENEHDLATDVEKKMGIDKDIMEVLEESVQKRIEPKEPVKPKETKIWSDKRECSQANEGAERRRNSNKERQR